MVISVLVFKSFAINGDTIDDFDLEITPIFFDNRPLKSTGIS